MASLTSIVEADTKGDNVTHKQAVNAAMAAIELVGYANARINYLRRIQIIFQMNKALLLLTEEDQNFVDAAPALFGSAFAQKSKELVIIIIIIFSSLALEVTHKKARPVQSVLT